jgi:hypothetical protein
MIKGSLVHLAGADPFISRFLAGCALCIAAHYSREEVWLEAVGPAGWRKLASGYQSRIMSF